MAGAGGLKEHVPEPNPHIFGYAAYPKMIRRDLTKGQQAMALAMTYPD